MKKIHYKSIVILFLIGGMISIQGCKKFLEIPLPLSQITADAAFANDNAATAAVNYLLLNFGTDGSFGGGLGIGFRTGLYSDELTLTSTNVSYKEYYADALSELTGGDTWKFMYTSYVYPTNRAIIGIEQSTGVKARRNQLLGEAYLTRAVLYFYLTNLYGDVALVLTDDAKANNVIKRSPQAEVYKQIIADASKAKELLSDDYKNNQGVVTQDRGRPNKAAASAMLARAYLYTKDWKNAEIEASSVLDKSSIYQLVPPAQTFLVASKELIWGAPPQPSNTMPEPYFYVLTAAGKAPEAQNVAACLNNDLVKAFEPGDARRDNWVGTVTAGGVDYYYVNKYKIRLTPVTPTEYTAVFRVAEQFLIRAEARAMQGKLTGINSAVSDINAIRARALLGATPATSEADILDAIMKERRVELFTELGHRYFDLRRTGRLDAVMNVAAPKKLGSWTSKKQWWPIPALDIYSNPNLVQTDGY